MDHRTEPTTLATITVPLPMPERLAVHFDNYGSRWGVDTVTATTTDIAAARTAGVHVDEWDVTDRAGHPIRIVRIPDPDFLDTISVIPMDSQTAAA